MVVWPKSKVAGVLTKLQMISMCDPKTQVKLIQKANEQLGGRMDSCSQGKSENDNQTMQNP